MNNSWENEDCTYIFSYRSLYPVKVAAALWCGIPENEVNKYLNDAIEVSAGIFKHPTVKCLEVKCRAIHDAIIGNVLPVSRENGHIVTDHITPARRHVSRQHLKDWIAKEFPNKKPSFLFDELEQKSHSAINADTYRALQADRDALNTQIENLRSIIQEITNERDIALRENQSLRVTTTKNSAIDHRSETTYLNIIGGLLQLIVTGAFKNSTSNQVAVVTKLLEKFSKKSGISQRNLDQKFSEANQSIQSSE